MTNGPQLSRAAARVLAFGIFAVVALADVLMPLEATNSPRVTELTDPRRLVETGRYGALALVVLGDLLLNRRRALQGSHPGVEGRPKCWAAA
jgi:hypothetical protein